MKLNPFMVMILMTVSGKLFGVWGLVLCLPITTYFCQYAIQYDDEEEEHNLVENDPDSPPILQSPLEKIDSEATEKLKTKI